MDDLKTLLDVCSKNPTDRTGLLVCADCAAENGQTSLEFLLRTLAERDRDPMFLFTGSRCYGAPREDSDWDWVVMLSTTFGDTLHPRADKSTWRAPVDWSLPLALQQYVPPDPEEEGEYGEAGVWACFRFGPVNVIGVRDQAQWNAWENGTLDLLIVRGFTGKPIRRNDAVACFTRYFEKL